MSLTINLCTRERPALLLETIERTLPNIRRDDTLLMVSADRDDQDTVSALSCLPYDKRILPIVMDREDSLGEKYNRALVFGPADVYLAMVDYAPHVTPGFDQKILDAATLFPDGIGVVYNRWANLSFPAINAVTARLAHKMGFIYPSHFPFWFVDHWLDDIARYIDRIAWCDVEVDASKRPGAAGATIGRRDVKFWSVLFDALRAHREKCARAIIEGSDFAEPGWRKQRSLDAFYAVREHSRAVNQATRCDSTAAERDRRVWSEPEEQRYQRIKSKAEALLRDLLPAIEAAEG